MRPFSLTAALLASVLSISPAFATDPVSGAISVTHAWARATPGGVTNGAVYFEIETGPGVTDRLIGVETPAAARAEIHTHLMEDGVMKMRRVDEIALRPGSKAVLAPHGDHIMLMDLKAPLKEGDHLALKLTFQTADAIEIDAAVAAIGAAVPANESGEHHHH